MSDQTKLTALLVDDEPQLLNILKQVAETIGMDTLTAANGKEALKLYDEHRPDIIISDIYMPELNGIKLLQEVKKINPEEPVVLITGYAHYRQLIDNLDFTPDGFLEKPFDLRKIIEIIVSFFPQLSNNKI